MNNWEWGRPTPVGPLCEQIMLPVYEWEVFWEIVNLIGDAGPAFTWDASDALGSN